MYKAHYFLFVLCAVFTIHISAQENAWPQFRGPNCKGNASEPSNPPVTFGEDDHMKWKIVIPNGTSSPVIWDNSIYLTGYLEGKNALAVFSIDCETGEMNWCDSIFPEQIEKYHAISSPAQSTPAVDQDGLYVYFASCGLKCYAHDGSLKWERLMNCPEKKWGHPVSPVVMDDKIILNLDYGDEKFRKLLAIDKHSGEIVWKTMTYNEPPMKHFGYPGFSTPVRYGDQVIVHRCGGVAAYSLNDGQPVWWLPLVTNGTSTPLIHNKQVFVATWIELTTSHQGGYFDYQSFEQFLTDYDADGDKLISRDEFPEDLLLMGRPEISDMERTSHPLVHFYRMLDADKNDSIDANDWQKFADFVGQYVEDAGLVALSPEKQGELSKADILWNVEKMAPEVPSPVAFENCVYMLKNGGWLTCMDIRTGKIQYQERISGPGAAIASPVIANSHLYLASYNGTISVIKAGESPVLEHETKLTGKIAATPAIVGDDLYVRTSEFLYTFSK